jgi:3-dehydroquinate synthase
MEIIQIKTKTKEYPLFVGHDVIKDLPLFLKSRETRVSKVLIITDEVVGNLYLKSIVDVLQPEFSVVSHVIPNGERAKSFDNYYQCQTRALEERLDRQSLIIALGGGVVGDLAGFVAATYMRGIPFIQIPTTLLAHDSAVGGKVAINHELGKNMIGAFHQPEAVFYDIDMLRTLPENELRSGFAEVIKHAIISDHNFSDWLQQEVSSLSDLKGEKLQHAIIKGINVKANIVLQDELETGVRAFLNFGHTLGHAIEAELGYGVTTHGEAVAIGMLYAIKISEKVYQKDLSYASYVSWFEQYGFRTSIPEHIQPEKLIERMKRDKKSKADKIRMVLLREIGSVEVKEVAEEILVDLLAN